jgi:hypothetical protein
VPTCRRSRHLDRGRLRYDLTTCSRAAGRPSTIILKSAATITEIRIRPLDLPARVAYEPCPKLSVRCDAPVTRDIRSWRSSEDRRASFAYPPLHEDFGNSVRYALRSQFSLDLFYAVGIIASRSEKRAICSYCLPRMTRIAALGPPGPLSSLMAALQDRFYSST